MADKFIFTNFAVSTLTADIGPSDTTIHLVVDDIPRFPDPSAGAKFPLIFADAEGNVEIVYALTRPITGQLLVERAKEGTQALSWLAGTQVNHSLTAATIIGAAGFRPRGLYNAALTYDPGDVVQSGGISYLAVNTSTGSTPAGAATNPNWQVLYQPPGSASNSLAWIGRWSSVTTYAVGNVVEDDGRLWSANATNTNSRPTTANANWTALATWGGSAHYDGPLSFTGTNNYSVTIPLLAPSRLYDGLTIKGRFANTNTGAATLDVNGLGAKAVRPKSATPFAAGAIVAGEMYTLTYVSATDEFITNSIPGMSSLVSGTLSTTDTALLHGLAALLTGVILPWASFGTPDNTVALLCNGQEVSRTTYARLFAIIGGTYGGGNGTTTFNVPDLRGRVPVGYDPGNASGRLGAILNAGAPAAFAGTERVTLDVTTLPLHSHGVTDPGHGHTIIDPQHHHTYTYSPGSYVGKQAGGGTAVQVFDNNNDSLQFTSLEYTGITINGAATGISIGNAGSGLPHSNLQPSLVINWIIMV